MAKLLQRIQLRELRKDIQIDRVLRLTIHFFVLFHILVIGFWTLPFKWTLKEAVNFESRPYLLATGLWQSWDMFAPNPRMFRMVVSAEITRHDGQIEKIEFPQMNKLSFFDRWLYETYRKWANDNMRTDDYKTVWPDTARWVIRQHWDYKNPPEKVRLIRSWADVTLDELDGKPPHWNTFMFYEYVSPFATVKP